MMNVELSDSVFALLLFWKEKPVGFAAIERKGEKFYEGKEYYVIPVCRREGLGSQLARKIFAQYPGVWEIKQIEGATDAKNFWQRTLKLKGPKISDLQEDLFQDPYWGPVTRQKFVSSSDET
jgi:predicted acetyltransferase